MSAVLRLALGSGSLRPDWREPVSGFVFRWVKTRSWLMESVGVTRRHRFDSDRLYQLQDSSVVEQVTMNHRDAGSNPALALRFSLKN